MTEVTLHQHFSTLDEAVLAFTRHATQQGASFRVEKRDKGRLRLKCDSTPDCPFKASVKVEGDHFAVVSLVPRHTCQGNAKKKRAASSRSKFVVDELKRLLTVTEDTTPKEILEALKGTGVEITYHAAWNAKRLILGDKEAGGRVATTGGAEGWEQAPQQNRFRSSTLNLPPILDISNPNQPNTATANTLVAAAGSSRAATSSSTSRSPRKSGRKPGGKNPPGHRAGGARPGAGRPRKSVGPSSPAQSSGSEAGMATPAAARAPTGSQAAERMIPISSLHPAYVPFMHYPHEQGLIVLPIQAVLSMAHAYAPQTMMSFPYAFGYPPAMAGMHPAVAAHQAGVNGSQHPVSHSAVLPAASTVGEVPTTASSTPSPATPARNGDGPRSSKRRRTDPLQAAVSTKVLSSAEGAERQRRRARTCRICVNAGHPETAHSCPGRGSRALCPNNPRNQNNTAEQDDDEDADGDIVPADEMDDVDADLQDEATVNALTFPAQTSNPPPPAAIPVPAAYGYPQPVHMLAPNVQPNPVYQTAYPYTFQGAYPTAVRMANYPGQPQGAMPMMQGPAPVAGSVVYVTPTQQRERVSKRGPRHCVVCNLTGHAAEGATCPGRGSRKLCPHYVPEQHGHQEDISMEAQLSEQMDNLLQHA